MSPTRTTTAAILFVAATAAITEAEIYRGIGPFDTLSDLKERFPGATFEKLSPAWAQPADVMYSIKGVGMSGAIIVKFTDSRPFWRKRLATSEDPGYRELVQKFANAPDGDVMVDWVRWMPPSPIPLTRFVAKYGVPTESGFSDEDLQPYRRWSQGLVGFLTEDSKAVERVDYEFTSRETDKAWRAKNPDNPNVIGLPPVEPSPSPIPRKQRKVQRPKR